jgi:hypothetical protein
MDIVVLAATGYLAYKFLIQSNPAASRTMNHYSGIQEDRTANTTTRSSRLLDQLTLEENEKHNRWLSKGNMHAPMALQGIFVKERAAYPSQSMAQKSYTMAQQSLQQTYTADKRSMFNIHFTRTPTALGENRPGFNDRISNPRVRL